MFMRNVLALLTAIFALLAWKFNDQNEKTIQIHDKIQSPVNMTDGNKPQHERMLLNVCLSESLDYLSVLRSSHMCVDRHGFSDVSSQQAGPVRPTQLSPVNMTDGNEPQHARPYMKFNPKEGLSFKLALSTSSGSLSYDTVFFLILIHMCGADVAAPISTLYHHMCWAWCFIDPALSVIGVIMVARTIFQGKLAVFKFPRGEKAELVKNNVLKDKQKEDDVVTTLNEVKAELENQRNQLKKQLKEVEADKEKNKQDLQSVEQEITEREKNFDRPEELLREMENFLRTQWKLDQTKKDTRRQLLNTEKLMEPIETLFTRRRSKDWLTDM